MSEQDTSSEPKVASAETPSAPPSPTVESTAPAFAAAPSFGSSRGSGLARGKRATTPAPAAATKTNETASEYKPTAIQVVTTEREYKNPFAPETPNVPAEETVPVAPVVTVQPVAFVAPARPAPAVITPTLASSSEDVIPAPRPAPVSEAKAELNILPPEQRQQPAQNWESASFPAKSAGDASPSPRREDRPTFRVERRDNRENSPPREAPQNRESRPNDFQRENRDPREGREQQRDPREQRPARDPREARQPRDPREARQPRDPRDQRDPREAREPREQRSLTPRPLPTPPAPEKKGFFAWLKSVFAGQPAEKPAEHIARQPEGRNNDDGYRRQHQRGGRGRNGNGNGGGYRGEQRGNSNNNDNRGPRDSREGYSAPSSGSPEDANGGDRNFDGGQRRRRHRGGRGRGGFDNRSDDRPDNSGGPNVS